MHAGWFDIPPFFRWNRGVSWQNQINALQAHWAALIPTLSDIYLKYKTSNLRLTPLHYPEPPENSNYIYTYVVDIFGMVFFLSEYTHGILVFQRWLIIWVHTVTNHDTATSHVTSSYVYSSFVSLCLFLSLNINCDTPKRTPEWL